MPTHRGANKGASMLKNILVYLKHNREIHLKIHLETYLAGFYSNPANGKLHIVLMPSGRKQLPITDFYAQVAAHVHATCEEAQATPLANIVWQESQLPQVLKHLETNPVSLDEFANYRQLDRIVFDVEAPNPFEKKTRHLDRSNIDWLLKNLDDDLDTAKRQRKLNLRPEDFTRIENEPKVLPFLADQHKKLAASKGLSL
jgi:hypothetical protein